MTDKRPPIFMFEKTRLFLEKRGDSLDGSINQTVDRYEEIIKHLEIPTFSQIEIDIMARATMGVFYQPASMIACLWNGIEDDLVDDLTGKVSTGVKTLIDKLKDLTYPQEVVLLEKLEQHRYEIFNGLNL
jgi:hypothetical protein